MAGPAIYVTSLRQALESVLANPAGRRDVFIESLHVSHASALVELLRFQTSRRHWKVRNYRRLKMLHAADSLLNVLACALLPALVDTPSDLPMLALLDRYAHRIKTLAATVGSTFHHHADILCDALILHAKRGRRRPLRVTAARLLEDTQDLRRRVIAFRSRDLHLSVVPVTAN